MDESVLAPQPFDEIQTNLDKQAEDAKKQEEMLASVTVTPAWEEVKNYLLDKSSDKAIVDELRPIVKDISISNDELGATVRAVFSAADKVGNVIEHVLAVVKEHEK